MERLSLSEFVGLIPVDCGPVISMIFFRLNKLIICCANGVFIYDIETKTIRRLMVE